MSFSLNVYPGELLGRKKTDPLTGLKAATEIVSGG